LPRFGGENPHFIMGVDIKFLWFLYQWLESGIERVFGMAFAYYYRS
jgi:hypothetical protein